MVQKFIVIIVACFLIIFNSCHSGNAPDVELLPPVDMTFTRFDNLLRNLKSQEELDEICKSHATFCDIFFAEVIPVSASSETSNIPIDTLLSIMSDPFMQHLLDTTKIVFEDLGIFETNLQMALQRMAQNFDTDSSMHVYFFISGLAYQRFLFLEEDKDALAIGLDLFLGGDYPYSSIDPGNPSFSSYMTRTFNQDHMVKKSIELLIEDRMPPLRDQRMIDLMVQNGIKLFVLKELLPATPDTVLFEYTKDQLNWCRKNELGIWSYFLDKELLYERDMRKISKYVLPSPNSPGMPSEAPGQSANFLAYKIVESYVSQFPGTSFEELLILGQNPQLFLESSRYKPPRK